MTISKKIPAKGWDFEIDDGTDTDSFVEIKGIQSFTPEPSSNREDVTDKESDGDEEGYISSRGFSLSLEGNYLEDPDDGSRDPGQERVEEVGQQTGAESNVPFRLTSPGGTTWEFNVTVDSAFATGGDIPGNTGWSTELTRSGSTTKD